jgi:hypothetical protein
MVDRAREQLLGYLFGALEESERESVERELIESPEWRRELAQLRESLKPLWVAQPDFEPPPGLAAQTCRLVAASPDPSTRARPAPANRQPAGAAALTGGWRTSWGWLDLTVAAGLVVAVSLVTFPAIQNSRFNARRLACEDHLRQLGLALTQYSQQHEDFFPAVHDRGKASGAGIYGPVLVSYGLVDEPRWFLCPGSPLADDPRFCVPSLEELLAAEPGEELVCLRRWMGGSYGYSLGFLDHGRVYSTKNLRRPFFALMADVPSTCLSGHQSINHDGRGQNVLFEDGRVRFYCTSRPHAWADDVFVNAFGLVAVGRNRNDSVVGPSMAVPNLAGAAHATVGP